MPSKKLKKHGTTKQLSKNKSIKDLNKDLKKARKKGYKLRESQPADQDQEEEGQEAARVQHQAAPAVQVHLDPGRGHRLPQQRPRRDPAGALHRAEVARRSRPTTRPAPSTRSPTTRARPARSPTPTSGHCPNDQNLIAVLGRSLTNIAVPQPPLLDRHNIPDAGPCIRCNLQIQGTGASPDAVTIDAGNTASGDGAPDRRRSRTSASGPTAPTASSSTTSRSVTPRSTTST